MSAKKGKVVAKQVKEAQSKDTGVTDGCTLVDLNATITDNSLKYIAKLFDNQNNELFEYIKERRHSRVQKVGVIVGLKIGSKILVSWSKCNGKADNFDPDYGLRIARGRALGEYDTAPIPESVKTQIRQFSSRCVRFFKDANSLQIV